MARSPAKPATPAQPRPVRLELNNSGAWKVLVRFDAGDDEAADKARQAGQLLGELGGDRTTLRISTDTTLPIVLLRWSLRDGWTTEEPRS